MKPRQTIPTLLLAALIVSGGSERPGAECGASAECLRPPQRATEGAAPTGVAIAEAKTRPALVSTDEARGTPSVVGCLDGESAALLAEQTAVQLLLQEADLNLTPAQWVVLATATAHFQTVRQTFEASIATVVGRENLRLEIPAYPAAGDALRAKFYDELRERLGEATTELIVQRAGTTLEGYFGGFGVGVQTLDFTLSGAAAQADYQVTRTARYWNSAEAREGLTLRRETHFPRQEDPTGERWEPFLTLLANRGAEKSGS